MIKLTLSLSPLGKEKYHPIKKRDNKPTNQPTNQPNKNNNSNKKKRKQKKKQKTEKKQVIPAPHAFMEDFIWHNIAQMASTSKSSISSNYNQITSHDYMRQASTQLLSRLRISWKLTTLGLNREGKKTYLSKTAY